MRRRADGGKGHCLVTAALKLKLRNTGFTQKGCQHLEKLGNIKVKRDFILQLKICFLVLVDGEDQTQPDSGDINEKWPQHKTTYQQTCKTCLGTKHKTNNEWIKVNAWQAIENTLFLV